MKQPFGLIAATSVIALLSAGTIAYAGGPDTAAAASNSHISMSVEGWHARTNDFRSLLIVNGASAGSLDSQSKWGWAVSLGYTFDDQSDATASFRHIKKENSKSHAYKSVVALTNSSMTFSLTGATNALDSSNSGASVAAVIGTENMTETGHLTYQQGNIDWGHTFNPVGGFYFRPYVGAAWRSIGYKDTFSFAARNNAGSPMTSSDIIASQTVSDGASVLAGTNAVTAASTGNNLVASGGGVDVGTAITIGSNNLEYDVSSASNTEKYLGNLMPSYDTKFTGIGPRFGFDSHYTFGDNFSVVAGLVFSAPYGTQKTKAKLRQYTDTNGSNRSKIAQGGTIDLSAATGTSAPTAGTGATTVTVDYVTNANLQPVSSASVSYSSSEHKIIPEMEINLGVRMSNDITRADDMTYFIEAGYRVIHDWNAIKNIDFTATTAANADGSRGPAFQYEDESDFGPYMKFGMTFGT